MIDHAHHAGHAHAPASFGRAFAVGATLNLAYVVAEAVLGLAAHSLALLADAGHNLADVLGLLLAWGTLFLAGRQPTARRTYGYKRGPILASLANAVVLLLAVGAIAVEAARRLFEPAPVASGVVVAAALAGVLVNGLTAWLFARGRHGDINLRAAFLHMAADAGIGLGVAASALLMRWTGWLWLDPLVSLAIAGVILAGTTGLLRESLDLAMDAVPPGIDHHAVAAYLRALPGVTEVHDMHIWGMSTTEVALTAHLVRAAPGDDAALLRRIAREARDRFGVGHATIQLETDEAARACELRPEHVV